MKIKLTVCEEERQMCSLTELHWGTIPKYGVKISQKKLCDAKESSSRLDG